MNIFNLNDQTPLLRALDYLFPNMHPDDAQLSFLNSWKDFTIEEGGDDEMALLPEDMQDMILILMLQHLTPKDIETYDNLESDEDTETFKMAKYNQYKRIYLDYTI